MVVKGKVSFWYLGDGEVQAHIDDDGEEEDIEGPNHQQRLLQHEDLVEGVMHLRRGQQHRLSTHAATDTQHTSAYIHSVWQCGLRTLSSLLC